MPAPGQFLPRASYAHRIACKALYRAILVHVPKIPLPDELRALFRGPVNPIKHLVRKRFKKNKKLDSKVQIVECLTQGYAIEETLRAATVGIQPALSNIHNHLQHTASLAAHSRTVCAQPPPSQRPRVWAYPEAPKLIDIRPLPLSQISSGRRHVPTLTQTGNIPFLRFKKPQSAYLNRILRDKLKWKEKRFKVNEECQDGIVLGKWEGEWEVVVLRQMEREGCLGVERKRAKSDHGGEEDDIDIDDDKIKWWMGGVGQAWGERAWEKDYVTAMADNWRLIKDDGAKDLAMGKKLLDIVQQEKALWETERAERLAKKERERMERKKAADHTAGSEGKVEKLAYEWAQPATNNQKPADQHSEQKKAVASSTDISQRQTFPPTPPQGPTRKATKAWIQSNEVGTRSTGANTEITAHSKRRESPLQDELSMKSAIKTERWKMQTNMLADEDREVSKSKARPQVKKKTEKPGSEDALNGDSRDRRK